MRVDAAVVEAKGAPYRIESLELVDVDREVPGLAEAAAQAKQRRIKTIRNLVILVVAIVGVMLIMSLTSCSKSDSEGSAKGSTSSDSGKDGTTVPTSADGSSTKASYGTGAQIPTIVWKVPRVGPCAGMQRPFGMPAQSELRQQSVEHCRGALALAGSVETQTSESQSVGMVQVPLSAVLPLPALLGSQTFTMSPLVASRS